MGFGSWMGTASCMPAECRWDLSSCVPVQPKP